jgi:hypothetical protein
MLLPLVFFDHLYKTAGTSLQSILLGYYSREDFCRVNGLPLTTVFENGQAFALIAGHVSHVSGFFPFRERVCITLLRHPVDRVISAYHQLRRHPLPSADPAVRAAHTMSLVEFSAKVTSETSIARDSQTRHFAAMGAGARSDNLFESAKAALSFYHVVGIQEEFSTAVSLLCATIGVAEPKIFPYENVGSTDRKNCIPDTARSAIERLNPNDVALWEWARTESNRAIAGKLRPLAPASAASNQVDKGWCLPGRRHIRVEEHGGIVLLEAVVESAIADDQPGSEFQTGELIRVVVRVRATQDVSEATIGIGIADDFRRPVFGTNSYYLGCPLFLRAGDETSVEFSFPLNLGTGGYVVCAAAHFGQDEQQGLFFWRDEACSFTVVNRTKPFFSGYSYLPTTALIRKVKASNPAMIPVQDPEVDV